MKPQQAFKFCPKCGNSLKMDAESVLACKACGFRFYINPLPTANALIINDKNEVLLAKRAREPKKGMWDVFGGFIEPGESLEAAVKREIREELGVEIEILDFLGGFAHEKYRQSGVDFPVIGLIYLAKITSGTPKASDDVSAFKFVPISELLNYHLAFDDGQQAVKEFLRRASSK